MRLAEIKGVKTTPLTKVLVTDIGDAELTEDADDVASLDPPTDGLPQVKVLE